MRQIVLILCFILTLPTAYASEHKWRDWNIFKQKMISTEGRVVDFSSPNLITTSEGQSYALFFALVDNDRQTFDNLLAWTENNLANGSFANHPIAWRWGKDSKGNWGILDKNNATDSDLWIAYTLLEAGRLWQEKSYVKKAYTILKRLENNIFRQPDIGPILLPGSQGFQNETQITWNPSYFPPQLMTRLSLISSTWEDVKKATDKMLIASTPKGCAPDWAVWDKTLSTWSLQTNKSVTGSYNAIRVYLWIGMMPSSEKKQALSEHFQPFTQLVNKLEYVPTKIDCQTGTYTAIAPVGFRAAMLPILEKSQYAKIQQNNIHQENIATMGYYNAVLVLFSMGWMDKRYYFNQEGELIPHWLKTSMGVNNP